MTDNVRNGHCIVAVYPTQAAATTVRERLIQAGVAQTDIRISDNPTDRTSQPVRSDGSQNTGFFDWLFADDVPAEDRAHYVRHINENRTALSVYTRTEDIHRKATVILLASQPIGIDDKTEGQPAADMGLAAASRNIGVTPREIPGARLVGRSHAETVQGNSEKEEVIPVVKEELEIEKRPHEIHRQIRVYNVSRPIEKEVMLRDETVSVERRPATGATSAAPQDRTIDITERH